MLTRRPVLTLLLLCLLVMGPVPVLGHPQGHDSVYHVLSFAHYSNQMFDGGEIATAVCTVVAFFLSARAGSTLARRWGWTLSSLASIRGELGS